MRGKGFALSAAVLALALGGPSSAGASVEIGQTQSTTETCTAGYDWVQPTVSSGNTYIVPAAYPVEVISSWSTIANSMGGTMALKVWRQVSGTTYTAIGHDQLRTLSPNVANTFGGLSIPVKPGDFLGLHAGAGNPACIFDDPSDAGYYRLADLADGQSGDFLPDSVDRLNISAVVSPSNVVTVISVTRNRRNGTAALSLSVPNPGDVVISGSGVKVAGAASTSRAVGPGKALFAIKAAGKKKRKLNSTGRVKLAVTITYTPTDGITGSQKTKLKLRKRI